MITQFNPALLCDGYKLDHRRQYPAGITKVYSNFTPRASRIPGVEKVVFFGLQRAIERYFIEAFGDFFSAPLREVVEDYTHRLNTYLGPNTIGANHIAALWELGYLPLEICALPEGTHVPLRVPMFTIENTHPDFFWLVNYFETLLSSELWLPCTSATTAYRFRKLFERYADVTGAPKEFVQWQGHDFSFRGMPGVEAAAMSGAGHLLSFTGTDTIPAIELLENYYGVANGELIGGSVAATEHSVMCAGGALAQDEQATFERLLDLYPTGILSVVSDTWDFWHVLVAILPALKDKIMARDGKLVIRPDSGDPVGIICGNDSSDDPAARLGAMRLLWDEFGGTVNEKGFKVLDPHIGLIYGDGISFERAQAILYALREQGFCSSNIVFGMGSYTYQYVTRDTFGFAMKATWVEINGEGRSIYKDPITDDGTKRSARGRLAVTLARIALADGELGPEHLYLMEEADEDFQAISQLKPVWRDGAYQHEWEKLADIRERVARG